MGDLWLDEGGAGNDAITNQAAIDRLWADATATGVAAALNISGSLAYKGGVSGTLGGEAVSDASTLAEAKAVALGGGDGDDLVVNEAVLGEVKATADAVAVAAALGVTAGLAIEGDATDVEVSGRAVSDASLRPQRSFVGPKKWTWARCRKLRRMTFRAAATVPLVP